MNCRVRCFDAVYINMFDERHMPAYRFSSVCKITTGDLASMGVEGLLLDIDNTLIYDETLTPLPGALDWVAQMQQAGVPMAIVSNAIMPRVWAVARRFKIKTYVYSAKKPKPDGLLKAAKAIGKPIERLAMVGDQLKTDMAGANAAGAVAVFTDRARDERLFKAHFRKARSGEKELLAEFERRKTEK